MPTRRCVTLAGVLVAVGIAARALAVTGDVAPGAGDGLVSVVDAVQAVGIALGERDATEAEVQALDVEPGYTEPPLVAPPTHDWRGDGLVNLADVATIVDAVLGRVRLPDQSGILLRDGRPFAIVGQLYENAVVVVSPWSSRPLLSLEGAPAGMTLDALGTLTFTPTADQAGTRSFRIRAVDAEAGFETQALVSLEVIQPRTLASGLVGSDGGEVVVVDPGTMLDGLTASFAPGDLEQPTVITISELGCLESLPSDATPISPCFVVTADPPVTSAATVELPISPALEAAVGTIDLPTLQVLDQPLVAGCSTATKRRAGVRATWQVWLSSRAPRLGAAPGPITGMTIIGSPMRAASTPTGVTSCPASGAHPHFDLETPACPPAGGLDVSVFMDQLEQYYAMYVGQGSDLGYTLPEKVTVSLLHDEDLFRRAGPAFVSSAYPRTIVLDSTMSPQLAQICAAHELFHVAQFATLDLWFWERSALTKHNPSLLEATAAWMDRHVLDQPGDPRSWRLLEDSRLSEAAANVPLDDVVHRYHPWVFFNYLSTALNVEIESLFVGKPSKYQDEGDELRQVDALLAANGRSGLVATFPAYLHALNVRRSSTQIVDIEQWGYPPPQFVSMEAANTASNPRGQCNVPLRHMSGWTWNLEIPSDIAAGETVFVNVAAVGTVMAFLWRADDGTHYKLRELPLSTATSIGRTPGKYSIHVMNPSFVEDPAQASGVSLYAWRGPAQEGPLDSDTDGVPDDVETSIGTDPLNPASNGLLPRLAGPAITWGGATRYVGVAAHPQVTWGGATAYQGMVARPPIVINIP